MKKILVMLLAAAMVLSIAACTAKPAEPHHRAAERHQKNALRKPLLRGQTDADRGGRKRLAELRLHSASGSPGKLRHGGDPRRQSGDNG